MKYSELLKLYKAGNLDKEQIAKVESDIERQQSISEYLFDEEQIERLYFIGFQDGEGLAFQAYLKKLKDQ